MTFLEDNAAVISLALAAIGLIGGFIGWMVKKDGNSNSQKSGANSTNIISSGDVSIETNDKE